MKSVYLQSLVRKTLIKRGPESRTKEMSWCSSATCIGLTQDIYLGSIGQCGVVPFLQSFALENPQKGSSGDLLIHNRDDLSIESSCFLIKHVTQNKKNKHQTNFNFLCLYLNIVFGGTHGHHQAVSFQLSVCIGLASQRASTLSDFNCPVLICCCWYEHAYRHACSFFYLCKLIGCVDSDVLFILDIGGRHDVEEGRMSLLFHRTGMDTTERLERITNSNSLWSEVNQSCLCTCRYATTSSQTSKNFSILMRTCSIILSVKLPFKKRLWIVQYPADVHWSLFEGFQSHLNTALNAL